MHSSVAPSSLPRPRWRLLGLIFLVTAAAVAVIWWGPQMSRQHRMLRTWYTLIFLFLGALVWLLAFSRLAWRTRRRVLFAQTLVIVALLVSFRHRGFTGDMVPLFEWRWTRHDLVSVPGHPTAASPAASLPGLADYAQFLGPEHQARLPGPDLARDWKTHPPELLWKHPVGTAWSAFSVAGRRAITQEQRGEDECAICYDLQTGGVLWEQHSATRFTSELAGEGPRATPTLEGERCYTQGATGRLQCLDLATGSVIWSADTVAAGKLQGTAKIQEWGISSSPCISGSLLLTAGPEVSAPATAASVLAFDKNTGAIVWKSGQSGGAFSSPLVTNLGGLTQVLYFGPDAISGYKLDDGTPLWTYPWPPTHPHVCMPLLLGGDEILVSSGYGTGSARLHITRSPDGTWTAQELWRANKMKAKFTNLIRVGDFVYGLDDGVLACLDARDGTLRWRDGKYRHGQIILVGALLLLMAEEGDLVLLDPQPDGRHELTRFTALASKTWNPPALAGRYLLVRNDVEAACYRLPVLPLPDISGGEK